MTAARKTSTTVVDARRARADHLPIAQVALDMPQPHLDRLFDYVVPAEFANSAQPGVRVRVRFAGKLRNGFIIRRVAASDHDGRLLSLSRVVSDEAVLPAQIADLARAVADRYAGTLADVLRLAVPPRHARVEAEPVSTALHETVGSAAAPVSDGALQPGTGQLPEHTQQTEIADVAAAAGPWSYYDWGPAFLTALAEHKPARAVWQLLAGEDWPARLAEAVQVARSADRGALLIVPDARDLARLAAAVRAVFATDDVAVLAADLGPTKRYRQFLRVLRGQARIVVGTRAAAFAPVHQLGLLAVFDDGDDSLAEPRAPYPHVREILMMRSAQEKAALLIGGFGRTAEGQLLVESGWAASLTPTRTAVHTATPHLSAAGDDYAQGADSAAARARISPAAFAAARKALDAGAPVLLQVPRRGYAPALACQQCRRPARCTRCSGPLALTHRAHTPSCTWCGVAAPRWACAACASTEFRMTVLGAARTAEDIGRAFPSVRLITSAGEKIVDEIPDEPAIVIATPGAEPIAAAGYGAAVLLDGWALLGRADLRAAEDTLRRWMAASALVKPAAAGGRVVVSADLGLPTVQALLRWDAAGHAHMELAARRELGFVPAAAMASLTGTEPAVAEALTQLELPQAADILGPVPVAAYGRTAPVDHDEPQVRALVRLPLNQQKELSHALRVLRAARSMRATSTPVRVEVDPRQLG